tara:strand:+ start:1216 stop:1887 length:672 start_codon:yes stop_codon:yes gene_type:complete
MSAQAENTGGCCCLFTVPAGYSSVKFETWGAGGDGGGGCCCHNTAMGAVGGSYAIKQVDTVEGCTYRICAAPSGCTSGCTGLGTNGRASWVLDVTAGTTIVCGCGGQGANMQPTFAGSGNGYTCCWGRIGNGGTGDFVQTGAGGTGIRNTFCHNQMYQFVGGSPFSSGKTSPDMCSIWPCQGCAIMKSHAPFPGGPGADGLACGGGYCIGQWGQAGMVRISYS